MKIKLILLFTFCMVLNSACAGTINPSLYQSISARSYRNNYNRNVSNRVIPYWQAQANYTTRGRLYQNYSNYNNYIYQHNSAVNQVRRFR